MKIPDYVNYCIEKLESAGFAAYCVGGCVRDACLGLQPQDYDLCTAALPEQTEAIFADHSLVLAGKKHGTVGVIFDKDVVEITTFRTEGDYRDNRHPQWVEFVPNVEEDLARRDFTVNAMAWSPSRGFADPFDGRADLEKGILRAVGSPYIRFMEDSLRILRGVRFAVRFGFTVEPETENAMTVLAQYMHSLAKERIFDELCKLLPLVTAEDLIRFAPILAAVIPKLGPMIGFDQRSPHHAYDLYTHTAHVTASVPPDLPLRWAALLHDIGKIDRFTLDENGRGHFYGHAQTGAAYADIILSDLRAPTALRERVVLLIDKHMTRLEPNRKTLRRQAARWGFDTMYQLLALQEADMGSKGTGKPEEMEQFPQIRRCLEQIQADNACLSLKDLAVNGKDLMMIGCAPGKRMGECLNHLLELVLDEKLENKKETLLNAARMFLKHD